MKLGSLVARKHALRAVAFRLNAYSLLPLNGVVDLRRALGLSIDLPSSSSLAL